MTVCSATSKRSRERCRRHAARGSTVCVMHGAKAPQVRAKAARRLAEARATASLAEQGVTPLGDPLDAFKGLTEEVVAFKDFLAARVAELRAALTREDRTGHEDVRADLAAYERALDRAGKLLGDYVRLGIEDRRAALDERRAALVEVVLLRVLAALGHDPAAPEVRRVVHAELVAAASGS